jgi:hypothetical protein
MARPLRVAFAGAWYHVTARGNERFVIFRRDADRHKWLELLAEVPERFRVRLHGYPTVSAAANRWPKRIAQDRKLAKLTAKAVKLLNAKT